MTRADNTELSEEIKSALKQSTFTDNHLVINGLLRVTGLNEIFKNSKDNIEFYIKKKGGILPDNGAEFIRWLAIAHPELRDIPCKHIQLKREYFIEFSNHIENELEPNTEPKAPHPKEQPIDKYPFSTIEARKVFEYLRTNYHHTKKVKWTYLYQFLKSQCIETLLSQREYIKWIKENYQGDMETVTCQSDAKSDKEFLKVQKCYEKYQKSLT